MTADVHGTADFYGTARGAVTARLLRERLTLLWPDLAGQSALGIGFAVPYLRLWREQAARCIALTPAQSGVARWPLGARNLSCTAEEDALPFADLRACCRVRATTLYERLAVLADTGRVVKTDDGYRLADG